MTPTTRVRTCLVATALAAFSACVGNGPASTPPPASSRPLRGYTPAAVADQHALESRFRAAVSAESMSTLHAPLTTRPHPAGSAGTAEVVRHLQQTLAGFGLDVDTHEYQVLLATPRTVAITMTAPARRVLAVDEPAMPEDPTSSHRELGGGYIAYSASGAANGQVVYVNYGLPADYADLAALGVSVKGKIALARYGRSHRAVKTHTAEQAGARALILFSDPGDDGETKGPAWPKGYWRGQQMLQRGNAKYSWYWHGDPLTPGVAATKDAARLSEATAPTLPKIPVVVLSWGEAQHLVAALGGPNAPERFRGGLDVPYRVGPGPAAVHVRVDMDQGLRPIYDIVASIRGTSVPDRSILFGTHHDAWTFGGVDPGTGATALLEVARVLGQMAKGGWRPARTISFAFWDAEEFGLIGSTEYAEAMRAKLQEQLLMYVNIDMYMKGRFDPGGVPSLSALVADVAKDVQDGDSTVYARWRAAEAARQKIPSDAAFTPALEPLGSGADFVPFQDHLAVPTMAVEFIGDNGYGFGTYHSNYDSRAYVEQVADPGFEQGVVMAQVLGTLALRVGHADVVPFDYSAYVGAIDRALDETARLIGAAGLTASLAPLTTAAAEAGLAARALEGDIAAGLASNRLTRANASAITDGLARLEQTLADDDGAPETRWYRHVLYGWNIYSLYDGQPFPGVTEAVRVKDQQRLVRELGRVQRAVERMTAALQQVRRLVVFEGVSAVASRR